MAHQTAGLFVGCGGLDLGFKEAGYELVWANDNNLDACETYRTMVSSNIVVGDIQALLTSIPQVEVLVGGPPCQAFSLVGKRAEDDSRASLVFAFFDAVRSVKPDVFVMENVPGMASSMINGTRLTNYLVQKFGEIGYDVEMLKLKAVDYFVPQKRQRIFLIGKKKKFIKKSLAMISPQEFANTIGHTDLREHVGAKSALGDLPSPTKDKCAQLQYSKRKLSAYSKVMRRSNPKSVSLHYTPTMSLKDLEYVKYIPPGGNYMNIPDEISTKRILNFKSTGGRTTTYGRLHPDQPSYTVNTYFNRPNVGTNYHYSENRLITPREAMRLQSFPDDFIPVFRSQRSLHMQIGNAVPPLLAQAIAESLKRTILA